MSTTDILLGRDDPRKKALQPPTVNGALQVNGAPIGALPYDGGNGGGAQPAPQQPVVTQPVVTQPQQTAQPAPQQESPIDYAHRRFPRTQAYDVQLHNDPSFAPQHGGNIEYMQGKYDTLPYYNDYPKPDGMKGKSVVVYNNNMGDATNEAIALDMMSHGLREHDPAWNDVVVKPLTKALQKNAEVFAKREGITDPDEKQEFIDSYVDGAIRNYMIDPQYREALNYSEDELNEQLKIPGVKDTLDKAKFYVTNYQPQPQQTAKPTNNIVGAVRGAVNRIAQDMNLKTQQPAQPAPSGVGPAATPQTTWAQGLSPGTITPNAVDAADAQVAQLESNGMIGSDGKRMMYRPVGVNGQRVDLLPPTDYDSLIKILQDEHERNMEENEENQKRLKRNRTLGAISDGISALANMYYSTKGAPVVYDPSQTFSGKNHERYEQLKAEREKNIDAYMRQLLNLRKQQRDDAVATENANFNRERNERLREKDQVQKEKIEVANKLMAARANKLEKEAAIYEKTLELMNTYGIPSNLAMRWAKSAYNPNAKLPANITTSIPSSGTSSSGSSSTGSSSRSRNTKSKSKSSSSSSTTRGRTSRGGTRRGGGTGGGGKGSSSSTSAGGGKTSGGGGREKVKGFNT